jgi:hypothetical protein
LKNAAKAAHKQLSGHRPATKRTLKMTSTFAKFFKPIEQSLEVAGDVHTISAFVGAIMGKPQEDDSSPAAKGISGVFGKKDERERFRLIRIVEKGIENKRDANKDGAELVRRFYKQHFHRYGSWQRELQVIWTRNAFDSFLTGFVNVHRKKSEQTVKTETTSKDGTKKLVTDNKVEYDYEAAGDDLALDFYDFMIEQIEKSKKEIADKHPRFKPETVEKRAFKELVEYFASAGVPHMPPDGSNPVEWMLSETNPAIRTALGYINQKYTNMNSRAAEQNWLVRIMLKI